MFALALNTSKVDAGEQGRCSRREMRPRRRSGLVGHACDVGHHGGSHSLDFGAASRLLSAAAAC